jgi:hypothetical protein
MAKAGQSPVPKAPQRVDAETAATGAKLARDFIAGTQASGDSGATPAAPASDSPSPLSGKHLVDWGGSTREVDIAELVERARRAEDAEETLAAAKRLMTKNAAMQAVVDMLEQLPPDEQRDFAAILQDPKGTLQRLRGRAERDDDDDEEDGDDLQAKVDEVLNGKAKRRGVDSGINRQEFDELRQAVLQIGHHLQAQLHQQQQQTLEQRVDEAMRSFPVFGEDEGAAKLARRQILMAVRSDPKAKLEDVAAEFATTLHKFAQGRMKAATERRPARAGMAEDDEDALVAPEKSFTGDQLMKGDVLSALHELMTG